MHVDRKFLLEAFTEADSTIISRGRNRVFSEADTTAHAEVDAIRKAGSTMLDIKKKKF